MLDWLKKFFNPKNIVRTVVDSLDLLQPILAIEIEKIKTQFAAMDSGEKAQWAIDKVQDYIRTRFKIETNEPTPKA